MIKAAICPICDVESQMNDISQNYFILELGKSINLEYSYCEYCCFTYNTTQLSENDLANYYSKRKTSTGLSQADSDLLHETKRLDFLKRYLGSIEPANLLEIGPGPGWFLEKISKTFLKTNLYFDEYNESFIDRLKNLNALPASSQNNLKFDVIVMNHVLEHARNPLNQLQKAKDCLTESGKIMIEVPNHSSVYPYPNGLIFSHLTYFSEIALLKLISKSGLEICGLESDITENCKSGAGGQVIRIVARIPEKIYSNMYERFRRGTSLTKNIELELKKLNAQKIAILGAGDIGIDIAHGLLEAQNDWDISFFDGDKVKVGKEFIGKIVRDSSQLDASSFDVVIIAVLNPLGTLIDRLLEAGFQNHQIINLQSILSSLINE